MHHPPRPHLFAPPHAVHTTAPLRGSTAARAVGLILALSGVTGCIEDWKGTDVDGDGWSPADGDCWDLEEGPPGTGLSGADIHPDADDEWYDGVDANCDGVDDFDPDGDGWVKEVDHVGQATIGIAGSGEGHLGAGDCYNTPGDADFELDALAELDASAVDAGTVYPGATDDWYDGIDQDCDGRDDYDADMDGDRSAADGDGTDCDDTDDQRAGTFLELCDPAGIDEDCDGLVNSDDDSVDPDSAFDSFEDADGDAFGNPDVLDVVCDLAEGFVANSDDCDDTRADVNPDAPEVCDADDVDENCNGLADDADDPGLIAYTSSDVAWADADGDNYGAGDTIEICDPGDELALNDEDCDDSNADINPAATEVCDGGLDNNCDGVSDDLAPDIDTSTYSTFYEDADSDTYGNASATTAACAAPTGYVADNTDCDDTAAAVNPGATEVCNGNVDDDCNGTADDADSGVDSSSFNTFYEDGDSDDYGDDSSTVQQCDVPAGYVSVPGDCDDTNAAINPGEDEICDTADTDEDCDGLADDDDPGVLSGGKDTFYDDADEDGYGDPSTSVTQCDAPAGYLTDSSDCDDTDDAINPDAAEICDASGTVDEDCNGLIDDDDPDVSTASQSTFYADSDSDTYGDLSTTELACAASSGFVSDSTDCDDTDSAINPAASEVCNGGVDDDCDGLADDADSSLDTSTQNTFYLDADSDGYGDSASTTAACELPSGYASTDGDCDDAVSTTNPGATEVCSNGADDDCDAATVCALESEDIDDAAEVTWYGEEDLDNFGYRVAVVPDLTGDGIADVVVSAYLSEGLSGAAVNNSGAVYIASAVDDLDVGDAVSETVPYETKIVGSGSNDRIGAGLSGGDFNNDGHNDLIIGAPAAESGAFDSFTNGGRAYLFLGPVTNPTYDIGNTEYDATIGGGDNHHNLGFASAVGDIDGDTFADLAVAAPQCSESSANTYTPDTDVGVVYVLPGDTGTTWFDKELATTTGIEFTGENTGDCAGYALLFVDTDGTGNDELVVGAPKSVNNSRGTVYIADTTHQTGPQLLADENALIGWVNNQDVGTALGKGDFNSDGYDDLLVGAPGVNADDGAVYVVFGHATIGSNPASVLSTGTAGASLIGLSGGKGQLGNAVAGAGDLDNDGKDDIVAGAWRDDTTANNAGAAWVVHGPVSGTITLDASTQVMFTGKDAVDAVGYSVAGGQDLNGDTDFADIVVGAFTADDGADTTGAAYVIFGQGE